MRTPGSEAKAQGLVVKPFLRRFHTEILAEWKSLARTLAAANQMNAIALVDHVPEMLDQIAELAEAIARDSPRDESLGMARHHAMDRLHAGFDVSAVVEELSMLRGCILNVWARDPTAMGPVAVRALQLAIDHAIEVSVGRYSEARERTLEGIDQISVAAFESRSLDDLLRRLLEVFVATTSSVDAAAIFLREGDRLRIRAGVGLDLELDKGTTMAIGEGFAGKIAAERQAAAVRSAYLDPLVMCESIRNLRVRALYGVPLLHGDDVIGVAYMGSIDASEFSHDDRQFFTSMAARATIGIAHQLLRQELAESEARLQSILDHSPASIWVKDPEGRVVLANKRAAETVGRDGENVIGRKSDDLLPPELARAHRDHDLIVLHEQRAIEVEESSPSPNGMRTFLSIKFPIPGDPPLVGGIATEITERKRMEDELRLAVRTREDVLAIVSHDLRNPLGAIQLGITMIAGLENLDGQLRRHLGMIHRAAHRMETLIDDLLDSASIRAGKLVIQPTRRPADSLVEDAIELQRLAAEEKGIHIADGGRLPGVDVMCDHDRLLQVFGNLIGNAIKFCRAGDTITVTRELDGDHVRFCVSDAGLGIEPDRVPRLFDAYWSGAEHAKDGAGLGLFICRGIVESHGGRIWVESTPGDGARFYFTLPIAR